LRVTISDVAKRARVSTATVSYVLNNSSRVSDETRARVLQAIKELGYQPNALARGLVKNQTRTVGLVIPHTAEYVFSDPYFAELLKGICTVVTQEDYFLLLSLLTGVEDFGRVVMSVINQRRVDGIIMVCTARDSEEVARLQAANIPFTLIGTCYLPDVISLDVDNERGSYLAAQHLLELGHRQIGYITGDMRSENAVQRYHGFQRALAEAGLHVADVYTGDFTQVSGMLGARLLLSNNQGITAIACASDLMAHGAISAARDMGYRIPEDLSIVGFDDIPLSQESDPKLTTVRQPISRLGYLAAERLIAMIEDRDVPEGEDRQILQTQLVVRNSTGVPREHK
jgi:LacI family transcriptional regulator